MLGSNEIGPNTGIRRFDGPVIIGAGPAGLATGYALTRAGVRPVLLERGDNVGQSWLGHYDSLRLNSPRVLSSLPGMLIDNGAGQFPSRTDFLLYLERYARRWELDIEFGVNVRRLERADGGWLLHTDSGCLWAPQVVVATGAYAEPTIPQWPGLSEFTGELLHARDYRNAKPYAGRTVLVVGAGQSAADVALECAAGGARRVWISVRRPPHISPPAVLGISPTTFTFFVKRFGRWADPILDPFTTFLQYCIRFFYYGDISRFRFAVPELGLIRTVRETGHGYIIDRGLMAALRCGQIETVAAVTGFDESEVLLADGSRLPADVVVCATGARPGLESLVGHLDVLDHNARPHAFGTSVPKAPGLYFIGFRLLGDLPDFRLDARAIARAITGRRIVLPRTLFRRHRKHRYQRAWTPLRLPLTPPDRDIPQNNRPAPARALG
ncbi:flavin-containing monooxygenase [Nocardia aurantia]|uniref:Ferredoxin--NADP reductase n=1 Tax=Nocardia aurantia TaxID=2585199 RepID=A0A7K0DL32_9NOCA|nr:NAD(P)/FAD-dependent oxidoreductase [Nocardia aurantia]MQY26397.1 Ferredoxin--NADP reductase [Nocardia aurantia]